MTSGKVFIRGRLMWLAWYPRRRFRSSLGLHETEPGTGRYFVAALGPMYLGLGPGRPLP